MSEGRRPFISVKFTLMGRVHTFLLPEPVAGGTPPPGESVVVSLADGPAVGRVVPTVGALTDRRTSTISAAPVRRTTADDLSAGLKREQRERAAHQFCLLKIRERNLAMKLTRVEQLADGSRMVFYFTAEGRVDFRELVRDLAAEFRVRIEMRQIGVRDEARLLGGYGACGRPLCCTTWLQSFEPVSIKMAKQQHLSLNPSKLSGLCGRLKCCLRYELANTKGETRAGSAHESACSGGCGSGDCGSGGCGSGGACGSCGSAGR